MPLSMKKLIYMEAVLLSAMSKSYCRKQCVYFDLHRELTKVHQTQGAAYLGYWRVCPKSEQRSNMMIHHIYFKFRFRKPRECSFDRSSRKFEIAYQDDLYIIVHIHESSSSSSSSSSESLTSLHTQLGDKM